MVTARCMKCRKEVNVKNPTIVTMPNSRKALKGTCPYCGTTVFKFVSKDFKL